MGLMEKLGKAEQYDNMQREGIHQSAFAQGQQQGQADVHNQIAAEKERAMQAQAQQEQLQAVYASLPPEVQQQVAQMPPEQQQQVLMQQMQAMQQEQQMAAQQQGNLPQSAFTGR